jgi:hypothetical protein
MCASWAEIRPSTWATGSPSRQPLVAIVPSEAQLAPDRGLAPGSAAARHFGPDPVGRLHGEGRIPISEGDQRVGMIKGVEEFGRQGIDCHHAGCRPLTA